MKIRIQEQLPNPLETHARSSYLGQRREKCGSNKKLNIIYQNIDVTHFTFPSFTYLTSSLLHLCIKCLRMNSLTHRAQKLDQVDSRIKYQVPLRVSMRCPKLKQALRKFSEAAQVKYLTNDNNKVTRPMVLHCQAPYKVVGIRYRV